MLQLPQQLALLKQPQTVRHYKKTPQPRPHRHEHQNVRQQIQQHSRVPRQRQKLPQREYALKIVEALHIAVDESIHADSRTLDCPNNSQLHSRQVSVGSFSLAPIVPHCRPFQSCSYQKFHSFVTAAFSAVSGFTVFTVCNGLRIFFCSSRCPVAGRTLCSRPYALCRPLRETGCSMCFSAAASSRFRAAPGQAAPRAKDGKAHLLQTQAPLLRQLSLPSKYTGHVNQHARKQPLRLHREQQERRTGPLPLGKGSSIRQQHKADRDTEERAYRSQQRQAAELPTRQKRQQRKREDGTHDVHRQVSQVDALHYLYALKENGTGGGGGSVDPKGASGAAVQTPAAVAGNAVVKVAGSVSSEAMARTPASAASQWSHHFDSLAAADTQEADFVKFTAAVRPPGNCGTQCGSSDRTLSLSCWSKHINHHFSYQRTSCRDNGIITVFNKWNQDLRTEECMTARRCAEASPAVTEDVEDFSSERVTRYLRNVEVHSSLELQQRWLLMTNGRKDLLLQGPLRKALISVLPPMQQTEQEHWLRKDHVHVLFLTRALACQAALAARRFKLPSPHHSVPCGSADPAPLLPGCDCDVSPISDLSVEHTGTQLWQGDGGALLHMQEPMEELVLSLSYANGVSLLGLDRADGLRSESFQEYLQTLLPATAHSARRVLAFSGGQLLREQPRLLPALACLVPGFETANYFSAVYAPAAPTTRDTALPLYIRSTRRASAIIPEDCAKGVSHTEAVAVSRRGVLERERPGKDVDFCYQEITGRPEARRRHTRDTACNTLMSAYASADVREHMAKESASYQRTYSVAAHPVVKTVQEPKFTTTDEFRRQGQQHAKQQQTEQETQDGKQEDTRSQLTRHRKQAGRSSRQVDHWLCEVPGQESKRIRALASLLETWLLNVHPEDQGIVFCNSQQEVALLTGHPLLSSFAKPLHAGLSRDVRTATVRAFRGGLFAVLVSTDTALRELDIPRVRLVVHYDPPCTSEAYVRRARCVRRPFMNESELSTRDDPAKTVFDAGGEKHASARGISSSTGESCLGSSSSSHTHDKDASRSDEIYESRTRNLSADHWTKHDTLQKDSLSSLPSGDKKGKRAVFHKADAGCGFEGRSEASENRHGLSVLLVDRGNGQHQAVARRLARMLRVDFSLIVLRSPEDMDKRYLDSIEKRLLSPAALRLGKPLQPAAELQLQLHGPRLLAAAFALLLQKQHRLTWRSALAGQFSCTPLLFRDPSNQVLRSKQDLLQLLGAVLLPTIHYSGANDDSGDQSARSHSNATGDRSAKTGVNSGIGERKTASNRRAGRRSSTTSTEDLSERLFTAGLGQIRLGSRGYVVDVSACAARRILRSEVVRKCGIKVTYATALQLLLDNQRKVRRRCKTPPAEGELMRLQQRVFQASSRKARMRAAKRLADKRVQHQMHCMNVRQRQRSAVLEEST